MNTIEYLDAVKSRYNWTSDYRLAKEMGLSQSRMSNYRCGKSEMDEQLCIQVANLLKLNPAQVLIEITAERTKFPKAAKVLREAAKQMASAAASLFLTLSMIYGIASPTGAVASAYVNQNSGLTDNIHYAELIQLISACIEAQMLFFILFIANQLLLRFLLHFWQLRKNH